MFILNMIISEIDVCAYLQQFLIFGGTIQEFLTWVGPFSEFLNCGSSNQEFLNWAGSFREFLIWGSSNQEFLNWAGSFREFLIWGGTFQEFLIWGWPFYENFLENCVFLVCFPHQRISFWLLTLLQLVDMYILQKNWSKTLIPAWNKGSNFLPPHIWSSHRLLNKWKSKYR